MEITIPFITALCIGFVLGGLIVGLVMKLRTRSGDALRAEIDTAQSRIQDVLRTAEQHKKEAEQYRIQAAESREERARLQTRFELTQTDLKRLQDENSDLKERIEDRQEEATAIDIANADLKAKLDAANTQLAERTDIENILLAQFKNIATDAITNNNEQFLKNADDKIGALVKQAKSDFSLRSCLKTPFFI